LGKQEIFKAIKNNRALSGLEGSFLLFLLLLRGESPKKGTKLQEQTRIRRAEIENFLAEMRTGGFLGNK
jgi:hypothetical protein